jgi:hypothetical protein
MPGAKMVEGIEHLRIDVECDAIPEWNNSS